MSDKEQLQKAKFKTLGIVFGVGLVLMLIVSWYATQNVAELCGYSDLLGFNISHIYLPWQYFVWCYNEELAKVIPQILKAQEKWFYIALLPLIPLGYLVQKSMNVNTSHGSAGWAQPADIDDSGLGLYEEKTVKSKFLGIIPVTKKIKTLKDSGVVIGINPYNNRIMLHDGPEHILLMAPTRSGKGVNTIIPSGLIWRHSIFFFDVKKELWQATGAYRRKVLGQKVMKFEPLCPDGSTARWNPLAEIDFQTTREISDISTIVEIMVRPDGKKSGGDDFWPDSAAALLKGVILHLLYSHYQEGKPLPCPTDIMSFLSSPDKTTTDLFRGMKEYPHISPEEFMSDHNVLYEIYGEYVRDWRLFNQQLSKFHHPPVHSIAEIKAAIKDYRESTKKDIAWGDPPWSSLLSHPKVAESAANMLNGAEQTRASIMQTAQTALALYQNPVVQKNTAVSDFTVRDLLNPAQAVSMYLCMEVDDVATVKPLSRLFINTILSKLIRNMKFDVNQSSKGVGKQRLLLMLDEFPQLGNMQKIELALAVCAGYGIKMCIVSQDVNQLNKEYTKDNSISSNCHVHVYFTPNLDNGGATAKAISESLGKHTISTTSHSTGSGGWFSGSDSTSFTGRELMTPDEVSRLSPEEEIVFIAGHKPIHGKKLRYYLFPWFTKRIQPELLTSDACTKIFSYDDLFKVHEAERLELEERIAEVKEEKAHILLDSAKSEKLQADQAVAEAEAKLESIKKELDTEKMGMEARRQLALAESQLAVARNASGLAQAHIDIYNSRLQIITLERMIAQIQAEKSSSSLSDAFVTADLKLVQAKAEYESAKKQLTEALKKEEEVQKTANAEKRQIDAKLGYLLALDQLEGAQKDAETIFREAEEQKRLGGQDKSVLSKREMSAKAMLDIATAAKESAERELSEAKAAYLAILDAIRKDREEAVKAKEKEGKVFSEDVQPVVQPDVPPHDDSTGGAGGGKRIPPPRYAAAPPTIPAVMPPPDIAEPGMDNEPMEYEDPEDDWEANVWRFDPVDEEEDGDGDMTVRYEEDEEDGADNKSEGGGFVHETGMPDAENNHDRHENAVHDDRQKASPDGARSSSEEPGQAVAVPDAGNPQEQLQPRLYTKRNKADGGSDNGASGDGQVSVRRAVRGVSSPFSAAPVPVITSAKPVVSEAIPSVAPAEAKPPALEAEAIPATAAADVSPAKPEDRFGTEQEPMLRKMDEHSWPMVRAKKRLARKQIMDIHRRQFPAAGQGWV